MQAKILFISLLLFPHCVILTYLGSYINFNEYYFRYAGQAIIMTTANNFFFVARFLPLFNLLLCRQKKTLKRRAILFIIRVWENAISCLKSTGKLIGPQAQKLQTCHVICSSTEILEACLSAPPSGKKKNQAEQVTKTVLKLKSFTKNICTYHSRSEMISDAFVYHTYLVTLRVATNSHIAILNYPWLIASRTVDKFRIKVISAFDWLANKARFKWPLPS